jgi:hypothetical protein
MAYVSPSSEEVNAFHLNSDKDSSSGALHHTLGIGPYQASPGNHTHDGKNSKRIKFSDIEGGWMNIDGGDANTVFGGLPDFDGGAA